ncbi:hypothetical protein BVRB_9g211200 [Beta vulgaris subsp. vulgaris]|nr:hypothetical protein BVRB_9g211200 [Beta vulgaris subsp. vulgaris]
MEDYNNGRFGERKKKEGRKEGRRRKEADGGWELNDFKRENVAAAARVLEAKEASRSQKTAATDAALENFK